MIDIAVGSRELGKSTLAAYLASERRDNITIDPRAQWECDDPYRKVEPAEMLGDLETGRKIVVQPIRLEETVIELAEVVQSYILDHGKDPNFSLSILFDEAGLYKDQLKEWGFVFRCSPRQRTSLILTAHRIVDINTTIRSIADTWRFFGTADPVDLEPMRARCGDMIAERVSSLKPLQFITWYQSVQRKPTIHLDPAKWREPLNVPLDGGEPITVTSHGELF